MKKIIVIGGGASGMTAALTAARSPENRVTLLERQSRVGRKLLSTGNGRCNLTNTLASPAHYHGADPAFPAPLLRRFPPEEIRAFFRSLGLLTVEEYGGRIYPMSDSAAGVLDVLRLSLEASGAEIRTGCPAEAISRTKNGFLVKTPEGDLPADRVIVACGGCAGAKLGGVSDGYRLLESLGHSKTPLRPALTQLKTVPDYPRALKGVRADAGVSVYSNGNRIAFERGDVLFTETGISGTAVFAVSGAVSACSGPAEAELNFFPDSEETLLPFLTARVAALPDLPANEVLTGTVHNRLGKMLCRYAGISGGDKAGSLSKTQLQQLAAACVSFRLPVTGVSGFDTAQVTAGGIRTGEFDADTLQSRLVPGLYACGEVLDVDGDCGGYNLQWAWASGLQAGRMES